jgi:hypothetical protein
MDLDGAEKTPIRKSEKFSLQDLYPLIAKSHVYSIVRCADGADMGRA